MTEPSESPKGTNIWNSGSMLIKEEPANRDEVRLWPPPEKKEAEPAAELVTAVVVASDVKVEEPPPEAVPVDYSPPPYGTSPQGKPNPVRYHLADERKSRTCKFSLASQSDDGEIVNVEGYFTVSVYDDGTPGEVFIEMGKSGHEMNGFANCWAIAISMLLQFGVHPVKLYNKFKAREFSPKGITTLTGVPISKSVPDLVMRWMEYNLPPTKKEKLSEPEHSEDQEWMKLVQEVDAKR